MPEINYIKIMAPTDYVNIWAWTKKDGKDVNYFPVSWPGKPMTAYDDNWNTYEFKDVTSIYVIVSKENGSNQSATVEINKTGYWWLHNGSWTNSNFEPGKGGSGGGSGSPIVVEPTGNHTLVREAASYKNFPLWTDPNRQWNCVNRYNGSRTDFRDESIYFAMTTRFYDGDPSNNVHCWDGSNPDSDPAWRGDFKGLIEKMDYIKALGFTSIWITPVVQNASGYDYHGYHASNFKKVDHRYESEDVDFQDVINAAHARDMKIILDVVFNHTGNFGEENLFPMFSKQENDPTINGMARQDNDLLPANYASLPGGQQYDARIKAMKDFRKDGGKDDEGIYHHEKAGPGWEEPVVQFSQIAGDCVDLNTENPTVANYLVEAYGEFIHMGVDAFRIDTEKHISRLTFNNYLFPALYEYAQKCGNNNFFMFGEVCARYRSVWNDNKPPISCPFYTWKENKTYNWGTSDVNFQSTQQNWEDNKSTDGQRTTQNAYLDGMSYHTVDHSQWNGTSVIDFPMHWAFKDATSAYNTAIGTDQYYNDATYNVVYVDSHDYGPDNIEKVRYNQGEEAWRENMSLMFTFRGVPCIYYGSEVQFKAGEIIDEGPQRKLEDSGRAYFGDYLKGSVTASQFGDYASASGTVKSTLEAPLSQHLRKLSRIRLQVPALRKGQYKSFGDLKFVRRYTSGNIDSVAAVAISGGCTFTGLPNGTYKDLYGGGQVNVTNGTLNATTSGKGNVQIWVKQ